MPPHAETNPLAAFPSQTTATMLARAEAERAIREHLTLCPFAGLKIEERLRGLENRFSLLMGLMLGSGLIGGTAGAVIGKLINP